MIDPESKKFWAMVMTICILASIGMMVMQCGCNSNSAKSALMDALKVSDKKQDKLIARVEGNANSISTVKTDVKNVLQITQKTNQTVQQGFAVNARDIGEVNSEVDNSTNSTLLIVVLFGMNLLTFGVIVIVMIKARRSG